MNLTGRQFKINAISKRHGYLLSGTIADYLGEKEGYSHYKANINLPFYNGEFLDEQLQGEVALNETEFWVSTENSPSNKMLDVTSQLEWLN